MSGVVISGLGIVVLGVAVLCVVGAFAAFGTARRVEAGALGIAVVLLGAAGVALLTHHGSRAQVLASAAPTDSPTEAYGTDDPTDGTSGGATPAARATGRPSASASAGSIPSSSPSAAASAGVSASLPAGPAMSPAGAAPRVTTSPAARRPSSPATSPKPSPKPSPATSPKPTPSPTPSPTPPSPPPPPPSHGDFTASLTANPTCDSGGHAHPGAFRISNTTSSNVAWTASAIERYGKGAWASVGPNKGTTNAGKTTNVSVKPVDAMCKKGSGSKSDHVEVSYNGGTLSVWFTVTPYS